MDLFGNPDEADKQPRPAPEYGTHGFWAEYHAYMRTPQWRKLRGAVKARANGRCENTPPGAYHRGPFSVHHLTYDRFKSELLSDLQLLCPHCHDLADQKRKRETAARNAAAYAEAGETARMEAHKASFFRTTYGEDWQLDYRADAGGLEEAYLDWIESKSDPRYD